MKIAIIETGNLEKSITKGLIITNTSLYLTKRNLKSLESFDGYQNVFLTTDNKEAQELTMYTYEGDTNLLISNGKHPEQEIDKVTIPKVCTIEGLNEMKQQRLNSSFIQGIATSYKKLTQLNQNRYEFI